MRRGLRSPTLTTLAVLLVVFCFQSVATEFGVGRNLFSLSLPLDRHPWTVVTTVYAHDSLTHLAVNALGVAILGVGIEQVTTPRRFHAFFLGTGVLAALTEVTVWGLLGERVAVVGASGAVLALFGYAMVGNPLSRTLLTRLGLGPRGESVLFVGLAALITLVAAAPRVALVAHFTGLLLGILAGRTHLLRPGRAPA
ncbi:rhomboid family intramembrane serine protease [Halomarina litorea]|uniref:rhomboid family intramembrane serine protease n=1 Tax=Halomarina litorea TaxID=2961595 RepID=UPI0020C261F3|nr:rhomboid family intramembrane serine protease [Halomarina sp. BCD28]